jgi:hypothetical protein
VANQAAVQINWRNVPPTFKTEEQLKQFSDFVLESINQVFDQDFEDWSENYREAVHGNS